MRPSLPRIKALITQMVAAYLVISKRGGNLGSCASPSGRRRDIGLGGYPSVSLAQAREKAVEHRAAIAEGRDPVAEKRAPSMPTFRDAPTPSIRLIGPGGVIPDTRQADSDPGAPCHAEVTTLDKIERGDVLRVLTPIWSTRPETARRVRQRMRAVFRGHGPRLRGVQPSGGSYRRRSAIHAEGEGSLQRYCPIKKLGQLWRLEASVDGYEAVLPLPGPDRDARVKPGGRPGTRLTCWAVNGGFRRSG